jgi:energy-coupling factor transporter transmembrane protein EcfT
VQTYDVNYLNMTKTYLKVLKDNCSRLRKSLSLEAFPCLEVWSLGHDRSILLSIVAQALLCIFLVCMFLLSLPTMSMTIVSGNSRLLSARFCTEVCRWCRVAEEGFHL